MRPSPSPAAGIEYISRRYGTAIGSSRECCRALQSAVERCRGWTGGAGAFWKIGSTGRQLVSLAARCRRAVGCCFVCCSMSWILRCWQLAQGPIARKAVLDAAKGARLVGDEAIAYDITSLMHGIRVGRYAALVPKRADVWSNEMPHFFIRDETSLLPAKVLCHHLESAISHATIPCNH